MMSTNTRLGAAPRTPTSNIHREEEDMVQQSQQNQVVKFQNQQQPSYKPQRRFGTVLSVNSPVKTPSSFNTKRRAIKSRPVRTSNFSNSRNNINFNYNPDDGIQSTTITTSIPEEDANDETIATTPKVFEFVQSPTYKVEEGKGIVANTSKTYTITFDIGPIGLQIDSSTWTVLGIVSNGMNQKNSPASQMIDTIDIGDSVIAVNGMKIIMNQNINNDTNHVDDIFNILQNTKIRRTITFQKQQSTKDCTDVPFTPSKEGLSFHSSTPIVPTNDVENRIPNAMHQNQLQQQHAIPGHVKRMLAAPMKQLEQQSPLLTPPSAKVSKTSNRSSQRKTSEEDELTLTRKELQGANSQIQQLLMRLEAMEIENLALRQQQQHTNDDVNVNPEPTTKSPVQSQQQLQQQQSYNAIREMEYKMRIQSLEEQLHDSNETKLKFKEQIKSMKLTFQEQSEQYNTDLTATKQELQQAIASSKDTMKLLESTQNELVVTKKQHNDEIDILQREKELIQSMLDQKSMEIERYVTAKIQGDVQIQQLDEIRIDLQDQLQKSRQIIKDNEQHAQQTHDSLVESIRMKDTEIETLRMEYVNLQSNNDKLQTNLGDKDVTLRQMSAEIEQLTTEKHTLSIQYSNAVATLHVTNQEKEQLQIHVTQLEGKVTDRNNSIIELKDSIKEIQNDMIQQVTLNDEAITLITASLNNVCLERDELQEQLSRAQSSYESINEKDAQIQIALNATRMELDQLRKSSISEKYSLLSRIEELEGTVIMNEKLIHTQTESIDNLTAQLRSMTVERDDAISQCEFERTNVSLLYTEIKLHENTIVELQEQIVTTKEEYKISLEQYHEQLNTVQQEKDIVSNENKVLNARILLMHHSMLKACLIELRTKFHFQEQITDMKQVQESLQLENDDLKNNNDILRFELSSESEIIVQLKDEIRTVVLKNNELESEQRRMINQLIQVESALETALLRNVHAEVQFDLMVLSTRKKEKELNDLIVSWKDECHQLHEIHTNLLDAHHKTMNEVEILRKSIATKDEMIEQIQTQAAVAALNAKKLQETLYQEKKELHDKLMETTNQLNHTKKLLKLSEQLTVDTTSKLSSAQATIGKLSYDLSSLQKQYQVLYTKAYNDRSTYEIQKNVMKVKESNLINELKRKDDSITRYESQLQLCQEELIELRNQLRLKQEELEVSISKQSCLDTHIVELSSQLNASKATMEQLLLDAKNSELAKVDLEKSVQAKQEELELKIAELKEVLHEKKCLNEEVNIIKSESIRLLSALGKATDANAELDSEKVKLLQELQDLKRCYTSDCATKDLVIESLTSERDVSILQSTELSKLMEAGETKVKELTSEIDQLRVQLCRSEADFQKSCEVAERQGAEFDNVQARLSKELDALRILYESECAIKDSTIEEITNESIKTQRELADLILAVDDFKSKNETLHVEVTQLRFQLSQTEADFQKSNDLSHQHASELKKFQNKYCEQKNRADNLLIDLKQSETTMDSLSRLVASMNAQVMSLKQSLVSKQKESDRELAISQRELDKFLQSNKELEDKYTETKSNLSRLERLYSSAQENVMMLTNKIRETETDLAVTKALVHDAEREQSNNAEKNRLEVLSLQATIDSRDTSITSLKQDLASSEKFIKQLETQLLEIRKEIQDARSNQSILTAQLNESKQKAVTVLEKNNEEWTLKITSMSEQNRDQISEANARTAAVEKILADTYNENESLKASIRDLNSTNDHLSEHLSTIQVHLAQRDEELKNTAEALKISESQERKKNELLLMTEKSLADAMVQVSDLEDRIAKLLLESSDSSNSLASEIIALKEEMETVLSGRKELETLLQTEQRRRSDSELALNHLQDELQLEKDALNKLTATSTSKQVALGSTIEALNLELEKYRDALHVQTAESDSLKTEIDSLLAKIALLDEANSSAAFKYQTMESSLSRNQHDLQEQLEKEKNNVLMVTEELRKLKLEAEVISNEACVNSRRYDEKIRLLEKELTIRTDWQKEWVQDRELERSQMHRCREDLKEANDTINMLNMSLERANDEVVALRSQIEQMIDDSASSMELLSKKHSTDMQSLKQKNDTVQNTLEEYKRKLLSCTEELNATTYQLNNLQSELSALYFEKNHLLAIIEEKNKTLLSVESELKAYLDGSFDNDSAGSPSKLLSKSELRSRCSGLQDKLISTEHSLCSSQDELDRKSDHIKQLSTDMHAMSTEISCLIEANGLLEQRVKDVTVSQESLADSFEEAHKSITALNKQLDQKNDEVDQLSLINEKLTDQLQSLKIQSKSERCSIEEEKRLLHEKLSQTQQDLTAVSTKKDHTEKCLLDMQLENVTLRKTNEEMSVANKKLEESAANLHKALSDSIETNNELSSKRVALEKQMDYLENECSQLRSKVSELQLDIETKEMALKDRHNNEVLLSEDLEKQRLHTMTAEKQREEIVGKLTEATRVVASQRAAIKKLESRSIDAERIAADLKERLETLRAQNEHNDFVSTESEREERHRVQVLEHEMKILNEKRLAAIDDANKIREDLRQTKIDLSESLKSSSALQKQVEALVCNNQSIKSQLVEAKATRDETTSSLRQIKVELDNRQMEIDHLKANLQVATATAARLKANTLLHESQPDVKSATLNLTIEKLQAEIQAKSSKITSLSELCKSQEEAIRFSDKIETQLIHFIEDIITAMDNLLGNIVFRMEHIYKHMDRYKMNGELLALDLAGFDFHDRSLQEVHTTLDTISVMIPHATNQLDERRAQLAAWKRQRVGTEDIVIVTPTTPNTKEKKEIDLGTPEILDTLHKMKTYVKADILSPIKIRTSHSDQLDLEFFKSVIYTLEGNIDGLLNDLQTAKVSLQEKDSRIMTLEMFISQLETAAALKQQPQMMSLSNTPEQNSVSSGDSNNNDNSQSTMKTKQQEQQYKEECKRMGGRLLIQAMESRTTAAKAIAFRQWSNHVSVLRTIAQHGHTATALSNELEETREKITLLKHHLKKVRRHNNNSNHHHHGSGSSNTSSSLLSSLVGAGAPTLDRIEEHNNEEDNDEEREI